jgi:sugar lactone lactonase YvrE
MAKTARAIFGVPLVLTALCAAGSIPASASAAPPTAATEAATAVSYEQATLKGTVNPEGSATSYWFEYGETKAYGTKIPISPESIGSGTSDVAVSQTVTGLSQSTEYHFRVVAENEAEETAEGEDATFTTAGFDFSFSEEGSGNGQLKQPNLGIATDSEGNVWVADTENNRVEKFNPKGEYLSQFGKEGTGNGEFKAPKGLAIDPSGNIWVVDSGNDRLQKFNSKGEYFAKVGEKGSGEGQFQSPAGITFASSTNAYIADSGNNRVEKFNLGASPKFLAQFGKEGSGDGEFKSPTAIAVDTGGIWVTDMGNNRVQRFNVSTFKYTSKFGEKGSGEGQFESPAGIASDFQGRLWVVDSGNGRAEKFNVEGKCQDQVGDKGTGAGQLSSPTGIAMPAAQKLLILDTGNNRVAGWTVKAEPPKVIARPASGLKATSAILNAEIDPEALATSYWFEYGTTTAYGTKVPITPESIGSGTSAVKVSQTVTGLSKNTTYHFRAVAESAAGTVEGEDKTFKLVPPQAITEAATAVEATQATLNGKVDPEGSATVYWFEYGTTTAYGTKVPIMPESVGSGSTAVAVKQIVNGLSKGTEYHFRVVAESEVDTTNGEDKTFTTSP